MPGGRVRAMVRWAWVALAVAIATGGLGFGVTTPAALAPLQFTAFLFAVLFLILLILGSPTLRNLI
jgi:uncharacterized membrane protein YtjA (UPF0391 family)